MIMKPIHLGPPGGISIGPRPNALGTGVSVPIGAAASYILLLFVR